MATANIPSELGIENVQGAASILSRPANEFDNDPSVETAWAIKALEHSGVYFNILCSVDPKLLKLTPNDAEIYKVFRDEFSDFNVGIVSESDLKSDDAKQKWRGFCERLKDLVEDYNFGTLLRLDSKKEYSEENSILVTRIQFYAIEIARNKESYNDEIRKLFTPRKLKDS